MILVIDNYDSFTYNLVQYLGELGMKQTVVRNDQITVENARAMKPEAIVISPGPCTPKEAGISVELVRQMHREVPILGVCLGHQAIGEAFGGAVVKASLVMHGKTSLIHHTRSGVFKNVESPFRGTRYHSLIVDRNTLPPSLEVTAWTDDGTVMGLKHNQFPTYGVQFHPESIATEHGKQILKNFLSVR
ncbi:MAG TPA: aminodeoxychorismate/anthranilate synthase component II [Bacteroidota bacterium]